MPFLFIFKHLRAPNRSWKIIHEVLEKSGIFLSVKECEPWAALHADWLVSSYLKKYYSKTKYKINCHLYRIAQTIKT